MKELPFLGVLLKKEQDVETLAPRRRAARGVTERTYDTLLRMSFVRGVVGATMAVVTVAAVFACGRVASESPTATPDEASTDSPPPGADARAEADAPETDAAPLKSFVVIGGQTATGASKETYIGTLTPKGILWRVVRSSTSLAKPPAPRPSATCSTS